MRDIIDLVIEGDTITSENIDHEIEVGYAEWLCSYCNSMNTIELNCRNCGSPRGLEYNMKGDE